MKCNVCGAELAEGVKFCQTCGAKIEESNQAENIAQNPDSQQESNTNPFASFDYKKYLKPVVIAVGVIIVLVALINMLSPAKYPLTKHTISVYYSAEDENTKVMYDNTLIKTTLDGKASYTSGSNFAGDKAIVKADDDDETKLYYINGKKVKEVATGVDDAVISTSGNGVAYTVDDDGGDELYIFNGSKSKKIKSADSISGLKISPDGKSILYSVRDDGDDESTLYVFNGSKEYKVKSDCKAIGLSNKGKIIYYVDEGSLYATAANKDKKQKILSDYSSAIFNKDHTQILAYDDSGKVVVSKNGKEPKKLGKKGISPLVPTMAQGSGSSLCIKSFFNMLYQGNSIVYVKGNGEAKRIAGADFARMSADGKYITYEKSGEMMRQKASSSAKAKSIISKDDLEEYSVLACTSDVKSFYLLDDETLYFKSGSGKIKAVKGVNGDVYTGYGSGYCMTADDVFLFLVDYDEEDGGTLYASKNGGKAKKIADGVHSVSKSVTAAFYTCNYDGGVYTLYASKNGTSFRKIADDLGSSYNRYN